MTRLILLFLVGFFAALCGSLAVSVLGAGRAAAAQYPTTDSTTLAVPDDAVPDDASAVPAAATSGVPGDEARPSVLPASNVTPEPPRPVAESSPEMTTPALIIPRDSASVGHERRLARTFGAMSPKEAARVLEQMSDEDVSTLLGHLSERQAAAILANLSPSRAARLGERALRSSRSR